MLYNVFIFTLLMGATIIITIVFAELAFREYNAFDFGIWFIFLAFPWSLGVQHIYTFTESIRLVVSAIIAGIFITSIIYIFYLQL